MADLPRLAITREQAADLLTDKPLSWLMDGTFALRLPERPTMPCDCSEHRRGMHVNTRNCPAWLTNSLVPIPEGTRVEVGWWELKRNRICGADEIWHPVATATVDHIATHFGEPDYAVTLTEIEVPRG